MWVFVSDKRKFECAVCSHHFRYKESICENWRDPYKSFLCPKCKAYLEVPEEKKVARIMKCGLPIFVVAFCLSIYYSERAFILVTMFFLVGAITIVQAAPHEQIETKEVGTKNVP